MALNEKREICGDFCDMMEDCKDCIFNHDRNAWCEVYNHADAPNSLIEYAFNKIQQYNRESEAKAAETVDHPSHYNQGGMECIDEMILIFGKEAATHFCLCNAWKYRYRANAKNGQEDLDKANWYIAKYKELKEEIV